MPVKTYQKRPSIVEAVQFNGRNFGEIISWASDWGTEILLGYDESFLLIPTLEGEMRAPIGWYIIKGTANEFYPCLAAVFENLHDEVPS